jgi:aspartate dehydrogenase
MLVDNMSVPNNQLLNECMVVGLIGYGNIGKELVKYLDKSSFFNLKYICDVVEINDARKTEFDELISGSELIIEAANGDVVKKLLSANIVNKIIMVMSTGGLIGVDLSNFKNEMYLPSGAIAGIDALKSVSGLIDSIKLITTKSVASLQGAPYIVNNGIDLNSIVDKRIIFSGNLKEAIKGFPKNINVAATISLAVCQEIDVVIVCDHGSKTNTHKIECLGSFGKLDLLIENKPSSNPKTSYLAVLSAIQTLKNIESKIKIGN